MSSTVAKIDQAFPHKHFHHHIIAAMDKLASMSIADHQGNIIFVNENFCKISGYSESELIGSNYKILNSGHHDKAFFNQLWQTLLAGKSWRGEVKNRRKDGTYYWIETTHTPIEGDDTQSRRFFSIQFEITEEKHNQIELEDEKLKTAQMGRLASLGQMAGGIAHEINNPLSVISGYMTVLERRFGNNEIDASKTVDVIQKVQRQVYRITQIMKGLKDFTRFDEKELKLTRFKLIANAVDGLCSEKLKKNGVNLTIASDDLEFNCQPVQIEQVLVNLISNAVDAIQNLENKWIKLECKQSGHFAEISVTDSGHGIPEEISKKLMQPFFTTKEVGRGTGLGLSISKALIEKHLGTLEIDSTCPNTRFVFRIPIHEQALLQSLDIDQAIRHLHGWIPKICELIKNPDIQIDMSKLKNENKCEVGQWISKVNLFFKTDPLFLFLDKEHHLFHKHAAMLVQKIKNNTGEVTEKDLIDGSVYSSHVQTIVDILEKFKDRKI